MIFIILLSFIFTTISVWIDSEHLTKLQYIADHTSRAILRLFVFALIGENITGLILAGAVFYLLFDILLNYANGKRWNYIGGTAVIDKFFHKHPALWLPAKMLLITLAILLYTLI